MCNENFNLVKELLHIHEYPYRIVLIKPTWYPDQGGSRHIQTGWAKVISREGGGVAPKEILVVEPENVMGGGCPKRHFQGRNFCKHL